MEPTGGEIDAQWHDNYAYNCTAGLRLKGIEEGGGPMYVYRNRIYTPYVTGSTTVDIFFYAETTAKIYIYNNSLSGVNGFSMCLYTGTGFPNTWIINNICSAQRFWIATDRTNWELYMNAKFYNNWCGGQYWKNIHWPTPQPAWFGTGNIINDYVQYWSGTPSFTIPSNSPCKDVGLDLSVPWTLAGVNHNALPGMFKGVPSGDVSLDMGAFQYGRLIQSADASVLDVDALKSVDLNINYRWAPAGTDTHLLLDLGETKTLTSLDINFKSAASRTYYFDLYTKTDGNYNLVTPTTENLLGDGYRHYDFTDHQARYILFVGNGSSYSANPNVNEVRPNF